MCRERLAQTRYCLAPGQKGCPFGTDEASQKGAREGGKGNQREGERGREREDEHGKSACTHKVCASLTPI